MKAAWQARGFDFSIETKSNPFEIPYSVHLAEYMRTMPSDSTLQEIFDEVEERASYGHVREVTFFKTAKQKIRGRC
jgi:hypothetical protein